MRRVSLLGVAGVGGVAAAAYAMLLRNRCLTWGATSREAGRAMPGTSCCRCRHPLHPGRHDRRAAAPSGRGWCRWAAVAGAPTRTTGSRTCSAWTCTAPTRCCPSSRTSRWATRSPWAPGPRMHVEIARPEHALVFRSRTATGCGASACTRAGRVPGLSAGTGSRPEELSPRSDRPDARHGTR